MRQGFRKEVWKVGRHASAKNMTAAERSARAKKASVAAAEKRTAKRLAAEKTARRSGL